MSSATEGPNSERVMRLSLSRNRSGKPWTSETPSTVGSAGSTSTIDELTTTSSTAVTPEGWVDDESTTPTRSSLSAGSPVTLRLVSKAAMSEFTPTRDGSSRSSLRSSSTEVSPSSSSNAGNGVRPSETTVVCHDCGRTYPPTRGHVCNSRNGIGS